MSNAPVRFITGVSFHYTNDRINRSMAAVVVKSPITEIFSGPPPDGLESPLMGSKTPRQRCETCYQRPFGRCIIGHPGVIDNLACYITPKVAKIVFHAANVVCQHCGSFQLPEHQIESMIKMAKWQTSLSASGTYMYHLNAFLRKEADKMRSKVVHCMSCHKLMTYYKCLQREDTCVMKYQNKHESFATPVDLLQLYNFLVDRKLDEVLGPEFVSLLHAAFHTTLIVIPKNLRQDVPSPAASGGATKMQTISYTITYQRIMGLNEALKQAAIKEADEVVEIARAFAVTIFNLLWGNIKMPTTTNPNAQLQSTESFTNVGGRLGPIRRDMLSRACDNTGRAIVLCNSTLHPGTYRCTIKFAMGFSKTETVSGHNQELLRQCVMNGPNKWPGAIEAVINGQKYTSGELEALPDLWQQLQFGDSVTRYLCTDDVVVINRPPTLLPTNLCGGRIIVDPTIPEDCSGIGIQETFLKIGLAGDADGDALLVKAIISPAATADAVLLMSIVNTGRSDKNEKNTYALTNNALIGAVEATLRPTPLDPAFAAELVRNSNYDINLKAKHIRKIFDNAKAFNSCDLLSLPLPPNLDYEVSPTFNIAALSHLHQKSPTLHIERGRIISGIMDNAAVDCSSSTTIAEIMFGVLPTEVIINKLHCLKQLIYSFLNLRGFSISQSNITLPPPAMDLIAGREAIKLLQTRLRLSMHDTITPPETVSDSLSEREEILIKEMNDQLFTLPFIVDHLPEGVNNPLLTLTLTQSKAIEGLYRLTSREGPLLINGHLPEHGIAQRISPFHPANSSHPQDCGYIGSGPQNGFDILDFTNQSNDAINNMISQAINTAGPGAIRRTGMNANAPPTTNTACHIVAGSLESEGGPQIISSTYGFVNLDPHMTKAVDFGPLVTEPVDISRRRFGSQTDLFKKYLKMRNKFVLPLINIGRLGCAHHLSYIMIRLPCNVEHILHLVPDKPGGKENIEIKLKYVLTLVEKLKNAMLNPAWGSAPKYAQLATFPLRLHILHYLCPSVLAEYSVDSVKWICETIWSRLHECIVSPGIAVGMKSIASMMEPVTQATLDAPRLKNNREVAAVTECYDTMIRKKIYVNTDPTLATVPIENEDLFREGAGFLVMKHLEEIMSYYKVYVGIPDHLDEYIPTMPPKSEMFAVIEYVVDVLKLVKAGVTYPHVLVQLIKETGLYCCMGEIGLVNITFLLIGDINIDNDFGTSAHSYIRKTVNSIIIAGISGIYSANLISRKVLVRHGDDIIWKDKQCLEVRVKCIDPIMCIEGVRHSAIVFQNPTMQASYFGILSVHATLPFMIGSIFPGHNIAVGATIAKSMLHRGEPFPLTEYNIRDLWPRHELLASVAVDAKNNLTKIPLLAQGQVKVDDAVSATFVGTIPQNGSNFGHIEF